MIVERLSLIVGMAAALFACSARDQRPAADDQRVTIIGSRGLEPGQFFKPRAVDTDAQGRLFVIDRSGWVQRLAADGTPQIRWRLPAWDNGTPTGMTIAADGNLWLADTHYARVLVYTPDGELIRQFGELGEGTGEMMFPTDVALDGRGHVYVTEYGGPHVGLLTFTEDGEFVEEWNPIDPATNEDLLVRPMALVWEPQRQTLLIADSCHHRLVRMSASGEVVAIMGHEGTEPGEFRYPYDVTLAPNGDLFVVEYEGARIQHLSSDGAPLQMWGRRGRGLGELFSPWGLALRADGAIVVTDTENHRLEVFAQ